MNTYKLEIMFKPINEFGQRNDIAIHIKEPTYSELMAAIDTATKDLFPRIVVYSKSGFWSRCNIKNGMSTWSRLIRDFDDADIRAGEVGFKHGRSNGDGITMYLKEV
jgi:hypothetical protein